MGTAVSTARPHGRRKTNESRASLWFAFAATWVVILFPTALVAVFIRLTNANPHPVLVWVSTAALSAALLFAGTHWWMRQPGSTTMSFGELMLWRWFRRRMADETIREGMQSLEDSVANTRREQIALLRQLNDALEVRDPYTRGHSRRVERHAYRTALAMHMGLEDIFNLRLAASLHDIGKTEVPIEVIRKQGSLDDTEWALMKRHPAAGAEMIAQLGNPDLVSAVRYHHERFEGGGYPDGIAGADIPLHARIIAVCDTFDAITSNRSYRSKSTRQTALGIIRKNSGTQFDPQVVDAFLASLPRGIPGVALLSWFSFPVIRQAFGKLSTVMREAGVASVGAALATSGMVGAVTANVVGPDKYLNRPTMDGAEQRPDRTRSNEQPIVLGATDGSASGTDSTADFEMDPRVRAGRLSRRAVAGDGRANASGRDVPRGRQSSKAARTKEKPEKAAKEKGTPPGEDMKVAKSNSASQKDKEKSPGQGHIAASTPKGREKDEDKVAPGQEKQAEEEANGIVDDAIETADEVTKPGNGQAKGHDKKEETPSPRGPGPETDETEVAAAGTEENTKGKSTPK